MWQYGLWYSAHQRAERAEAWKRRGGGPPVMAVSLLQCLEWLNSKGMTYFRNWGGGGGGGGSLQRRSFRTLEPGICQNEKKKNGWWTTVSKTKNLDGEFLPAEFIAGSSGSWIMSREIAVWSNGSWITGGKISPDAMDLVPVQTNVISHMDQS